MKNALVIAMIMALSGPAAATWGGNGSNKAYGGEGGRGGIGFGGDGGAGGTGFGFGKANATVHGIHGGTGGNPTATGIGGNPTATGIGGNPTATGIGGNPTATGTGGNPTATGTGGNPAASGIGGSNFTNVEGDETNAYAVNVSSSSTNTTAPCQKARGFGAGYLLAAITGHWTTDVNWCKWDLIGTNAMKSSDPALRVQGKELRTININIQIQEARDELKVRGTLGRSRANMAFGGTENSLMMKAGN